MRENRNTEDNKRDYELIELENRTNYYNSLGNGNNIKTFSGSELSIGNGWVTRNASTLAVQTSNSVILMHNGSCNRSQVNILYSLENISCYKNTTMYIYVEAKVHRYTDKNAGGMLGFINSNNYNGGVFFSRTVIKNSEWNRITLKIDMTEEIVENGGIICLRSYVDEMSSAVVEFRNFCISLNENKNFDINNKNITDGWNVIQHLAVEQNERKIYMERYQKVLRGYEVANRIISDNLSKHFFIMQKHIGDVMRMMKNMIIYRLFYSEANLSRDEKYRDCLSNVVIPNGMEIITSSLNSGVCRLYNSIDNILILDKTDLDNIAYYAKSGFCVHSNLHCDEYGLFGDRVGEQEISTMYGVGGHNWLLNIPTTYQGKNDRILGSIEVKKESIQKAKEILEKNQTDAMHTVILCPSARSSSGILEQFWRKAILYLKNHGYTVFTNVGANDAELKETIRLFVPVDVYAALGYVGATIIGVQSGIIDVIRWLMLDISLIDIHALFTPIDYKYAQNRNVNFPIDRKANVLHMGIDPSELDSFSDKLIDVFKYNQKGHNQKMRFETMEVPNKLNNICDLNTYLEQVRELKDSIVFMSVYDSANKYWNKVDTSILNIESDLSLSWRRSFVAVIDLENDFHYEEMKENCAFAVYQGVFEDLSSEKESDMPIDNQYYVRSHAMGANHYTRSAIVINGQNYSQSGRGLNIVVYDKKLKQVIDSVYVDLWADEKLTIRRKELDINGKL